MDIIILLPVPAGYCLLNWVSERSCQGVMIHGLHKIVIRNTLYRYLCSLHILECAMRIRCFCCNEINQLIPPARPVEQPMVSIQLPPVDGSIKITANQHRQSAATTAFANPLTPSRSCFRAVQSLLGACSDMAIKAGLL